MKLILSDIHNPEHYRPSQCPHCGKAGLWMHGVYYRKACCEKGVGCPAPIQRFRCPPKHCGRTCSVLPEYISPQRWYHWAIQQLTLMLLMAGWSLMAVRNLLFKCPLLIPKVPSVSTIYRWYQCLQSHFDGHKLHICNEYPELGIFQGYNAFWYACLLKVMLSRAMIIINKADYPIP